ncbi:MAG: tetratricopeptide repeat protein, partial [Candidatus Hodarchaeales archaeon]
SLDQIFQKSMEDNWNTNMDFISEFTRIANQKHWYDLISKTLKKIHVLSLDTINYCILEYIWARLARQLQNRKQFLSHMQKSLDCKALNPKYYINLSLSFVWMLQNPFGEYRRAHEILSIILPIKTSPSQRIFVLNSLGSNLRFLGEYDLAIEYLTKSIKLNNDKVHDLWQAAYTHNTLGMICTIIGNIEEAREHYHNSVKLNTKINDHYGLGFTYGAMGWLEANQGKLYQATEYYQKSIATFEEKAGFVPSIILLAYAEILSRTGINNQNKIDSLIARGKARIWESQRQIDKGRYYNTLGIIALNQNQPDRALKEFSKALEYGESFEVEVQTFLGLAKSHLELFMLSYDLEHLKRANLLLIDLRSAAESSALISGEVDLILGIIDTYKNKFSSANQRFSRVINYAQAHKLSFLEEKAFKQKETLQILQTHDRIHKVTAPSKDLNFKRNSIKEAIIYLTELTKLMGTYTAKKKEED